MLFLYYRSLQIRMGGKKGKAWIDEDVLFREIRACSKDLLLAIATPTVSFFEGQIDRYHLYFQTAASPRRQEILRNDSFARNSYKRGINHLYRGYNSIPLNSGKIIRQSESKF